MFSNTSEQLDGPSPLNPGRSDWSHFQWLNFGDGRDVDMFPDFCMDSVDLSDFSTTLSPAMDWPVPDCNITDSDPLAYSMHYSPPAEAVSDLNHPSSIITSDMLPTGQALNGEQYSRCLKALHVPELRARCMKLGLQSHKKLKKSALIEILVSHNRKGSNGEGEVFETVEQPIAPHRPHKGRRNPHALPPARVPLSEERAREMRSSVAWYRGVQQEALLTPKINIYQWACRLVDDVKNESSLRPNTTSTPTITGYSFRQVQPMAIETSSGIPAGDSPYNPVLSSAVVLSPPSALNRRTTNQADIGVREVGIQSAAVGDDSCKILCGSALSLPASPQQERTTTLVGSKEPYVIELGLGVHLAYYESDFREPPSLTGLVSSPAHLLEVWDDRFSTGNREPPLVVRGIPVAVKHWQSFYSKFEKKRWKDMKQTWGSYKILMDEYCSMDSREFNLKWARKHPETGELSLRPSGEIINSLRKLQSDRDSDIASMARYSYPGDLFAQYFSYPAQGRKTVMKSDKAIAKRYLELTAKTRM